MPRVPRFPRPRTRVAAAAALLRSPPLLGVSALRPPAVAPQCPGTVLGAELWSLRQGSGHGEEGATYCTLMTSIVRSRMVTSKVLSAFLSSE